MFHIGSFRERHASGTSDNNMIPITAHVNACIKSSNSRHRVAVRPRSWNSRFTAVLAAMRVRPTTPPLMSQSDMSMNTREVLSKLCRGRKSRYRRSLVRNYFSCGIEPARSCIFPAHAERYRKDVEGSDQNNHSNEYEYVPSDVHRVRPTKETKIMQWGTTGMFETRARQWHTVFQRRKPFLRNCAFGEIETGKDFLIVIHAC